MYSTTWCGYCRRLKSQMDREGIAYTEVNIEDVPDAAAYVMKVNGGNQTVPTVLFPDGSAATNPSLAEVKVAHQRLTRPAPGPAGRHRPTAPARAQRQVPSWSTGPPSQRSTRRRATDTLGGTVSSPAATAARRPSRSNQRTSVISSPSGTASVSSVSAWKASMREAGNGHGWLPR